VQVWDQGSSVITTYTRNTSFESNAGDTGYSINYNNNNPSITFNKELTPTKNFQLIFQYLPPSVSEGGDLSQSAFGFDGSFMIGNAFRVDTAYAKSETDQLISSAATTETFAGNGTKTYTLHCPSGPSAQYDGILEGTEQIYVNNNLLNRDLDYFISYSGRGQFSFYYITPATSDVISVQYNYYSPLPTSGSSVANTKADTAFRLAAETRLWGDALTISGAAKRIGFDFSPLGSTTISNGTEYEEYNLGLKPPWQQFYGNYAYKFNKNPIGTTRTTFLRTYDHALSTGINPGGLANINLNYRQYNSLDDPLTSGAAHNNDSQQETFTASLAPADWSRGALSINQNYSFSRTSTKNETADIPDRNPTSRIDYYRVGGGLKLTDRFSAGLDFQYNESVSTNSLEVTTDHIRSTDNAYNAQLDLTMLFLQKWTARASLQNHEDLKFAPTPESVVRTMNETYHMDITPFTILTGSLDHNRQERISYVTGQENPLSLRTAASARLSPFSFLSFGANYSKSENIPETGVTYKTSGNSRAGDISFTPLSLALVKLNTNFAASKTLQTGPQGTVAVTTQTDTFAWNYTLTFNVLPVLPLTLGFAAEDYKNYNNAPTAPVTTETQNQTTTANLSVILPFLPQLVFSADYSQKLTKDLLLKRVLRKVVTNQKASYQIVTWGQLTYDVNQETNGGEVQAGAVVPLDLQKTTSTLGLNIKVPVDNPVLNNLTLVASVKEVDYRNNARSSDNFKARLVSLEGTMNF
jgi:hypothetical protein